jgi:hypothetical protein
VARPRPPGSASPRIFASIDFLRSRTNTFYFFGDEKLQVLTLWTVSADGLFIYNTVVVIQVDGYKVYPLYPSAERALSVPPKKEHSSTHWSLAELVFLVLFLKKNKYGSARWSLTELVFLVLFLKKNKYGSARWSLAELVFLVLFKKNKYGSIRLSLAEPQV